MAAAMAGEENDMGWIILPSGSWMRDDEPWTEEEIDEFVRTAMGVRACPSPTAWPHKEEARQRRQQRLAKLHQSPEQPEDPEDPVQQ